MGNNHSTTKEKKDRKSHLKTRSSETVSSNQMDLRSDLFVLAEKWTKLSKVLATEDFVDGGSSNYQVITKSAFENQMHPTASFLGSLLFDHFQLGSSHRNSDKDPSVMTHAAFVSNVTHVLGLNSDTDQGEYYFRVFSRGADTLKEDELLLLLFTTVKIACSATGLSKSISDADQQIFQSVVRTLDPKRISEVELSQFQNWIRENDIHLLNCLHHFVVQSLVTCTGLSNDSFTGFSHMEDDTLPKEKRAPETPYSLVVDRLLGLEGEGAINDLMRRSDLKRDDLETRLAYLQTSAEDTTLYQRIETLRKFYKSSEPDQSSPALCQQTAKETFYLFS